MSLEPRPPPKSPEFFMTIPNWGEYSPVKFKSAYLLWHLDGCLTDSVGFIAVMFWHNLCHGKCAGSLCTTISRQQSHDHLWASHFPTCITRFQRPWTGCEKQRWQRSLWCLVLWTGGLCWVPGRKSSADHNDLSVNTVLSHHGEKQTKKKMKFTNMVMVVPACNQST